MINPFLEVNWHPGSGEIRKFALGLVVGFPCLAVGLLVLKRIADGNWQVAPSFWIGGVGGGLGLLLLLLPAAAKPFYLMWYLLACCIGVVVSNVLFACFYLLVFTSIGLFLRAVGRSPLRKAPNPQAESYWQDAEQVSNPERYYSQF